MSYSFVNVIVEYCFTSLFYGKFMHLVPSSPSLVSCARDFMALANPSLQTARRLFIATSLYVKP